MKTTPPKPIEFRSTIPTEQASTRIDNISRYAKQIRAEENLTELTRLAEIENWLDIMEDGYVR